LARSLSISPSYLNQIENNQRPLTAAVLLKLSAAYDIDLQMLSDDEDDRVAAELHAAMCDSIFSGNLISISELKEVTALSPDFYFARSGGACPLWNIHDAFTTPGTILKQLAQMPDGRTYFCIARTVTKQAGGYLEPERKFAIGFGCEVRHAPELVYATGMDLDNADAVVPIGPSCRLCERLDCAQRASPAVGHKLRINENQRSFQPYQYDM
jgi:hypothetical protein